MRDPEGTHIEATDVVLDAVHVSYRVGGESVHALADFSHTFRRGTSTAIQGRSGSGKSTLVSVMSLLRRPTSGRVIIRGREVESLSERDLAYMRSSHVGIVFQSFHLDYGADAADNVILPWAYARDQQVSRRVARRKATDLLERLGVGSLATRRPSAMSGGQRQRVAIARALFNDPALLIADEPTGNLDEDTAGDIARDLFALSTDLGTTVVIVTHDEAVAGGAQVRLQLVHGRLQHRCLS